MVGPPQSGGMEAVVWLPAKQQVRGPGACFMQILGSELLLFLISLTEGANTGPIWRSGQICVLVTETHYFSTWHGTVAAWIWLNIIYTGR